MLDKFCRFCGHRLSIANTDGICDTCADAFPLQCSAVTDGVRCPNPKYIAQSGKTFSVCRQHWNEQCRNRYYANPDHARELAKIRERRSIQRKLERQAA